MAGLTSAIVGFTSSFAVVLAGLRAMGADPAQAASGLMAVSVTMGLGCIVLAATYRRPITVAWSTPGAALLASSIAPTGGFAAAVGAFIVCGILLVATGFIPVLERAVRSIPSAIANAMLAGVLLTLCIAPFRDLPKNPIPLGAMILTWAVVAIWKPRWAVPATLVVVLIVTTMAGPIAGEVMPRLVLVAPTFEWQTMVAVALPLYLVTMTSQNIPGVAVLKSLGYDVPLRPSLAYTGTASALGAFAGGHAINLSAIAAALAAGPEAGADKSKRWIAAVTCGIAYVTFGFTSQAVVLASHVAPEGLFAGLAGLALLGTLGASVSAAVHEAGGRLSAIVTFVVAASGVQFLGIGPAFWALLAGGAMIVLGRLNHRLAR